jgi:hypothetical protein
MRPWLLLAWLGAATLPSTRADEPTQARSDVCQVRDNHILGPRTAGRPLPLYTRDPTGGIHSACSVPWSALSPKNEALPVLDCFRGSLLQVANDTACGSGIGPLWVSARWVVTSGEEPPPPNPVATCQQLETSAYAVSRDYKPDCAARKTKPQPRSLSQPPAAETPSRESPPAPAPPPPQSASPDTAPPEPEIPATPHPAA